MEIALNISTVNDSELVACAAAGNRDAFTQIVSRYQSLVCSLAYSATGNLSQSEDIAQETFFAAWKGLHALHEPERLRSWLCGIARNIIAGAVRNTKREPAHVACTLDASPDIPSTEKLPIDRVISHEEEAILWRSLDRIPLTYREPLILFYREGESVANVANMLGLSEEVVRQKLSRGRKLLKMEIASFVENALQRSKPGCEFTTAVLSGLPTLSLSTSGVMPETVTAGIAVKSSSFLAFMGALVTPILGSLGGFMTAIILFKNLPSREKAFYGMLVSISAVLMGMAILKVPEIYVFPIFMAIVAGMALIYVRWIHPQVRRNSTDTGTTPPAGVYTKLNLWETKSKWIIYGYLLTLIFSHPFATLIHESTAAQDTLAQIVVLTICGGVFFLLRRNFLQNSPEQRLRKICILETIFFLLFLSAVALRWETWRGHPIWEAPEEVALRFQVGVFLFVVFLAAWFMKRQVLRRYAA